MTCLSLSNVLDPKDQKSNAIQASKNLQEDNRKDAMSPELKGIFDPTVENLMETNIGADMSPDLKSTPVDGAKR